MSLGSICFAQNRTIDSLLTLLNSDKSDSSKASHLNQLSRAYYTISEYEKGLKYGNEVLVLAKATPDSSSKEWLKEIGSAYFTIGQIYFYKDNYPAAIKNYTDALTIFNRIGDKKKAYSIHKNVGNLSYAQANYPQALKDGFAALKIAKETDNKSYISESYNTIGMIYFAMGDFEEALKNNFTAMKIKNELADKKGVADVYGTIGTIYISQGNYSEALENLSKSIEIYKELGNNRFLAYAYNNIGVAYQSLANYDEALRYFEMSLKIKEKMGDKLGISSTFINLGDVHTKLNHLKLAKEYLDKALDLSIKSGSKDRIKDCYKSLTTLDSLQGRWKDAYQHHLLFITYRDSIDNEETKKKVIQTAMRFEFDEEQAKIKAEQEKKDVLAEEEKKRTRQSLILVSCVLLLVFIFAGFIFRSLAITRKQKQLIEIKNNETEEQKKIIEEKNKDITDSIHYAKRIQHALLREEESVSPHLPDHFILFLPKDIVSGDFYWGFEKQEYWYFAAVDCTGHGVPGAIMSMLGISFLNDIALSEKLLSPSEILDKLRDRIIHELRQGDEAIGNRDGMDISLCRLNLKTLELQWAGANNALNIVRDGKLEEIKADKQPIGHQSGARPFTNHELQLLKGDSIYIFSDGYADQFGGPKGKKLTYKRLENLFVEQNYSSLKEQKEVLKKFFFDWKGAQEQVDDVCIIGVRV